MNRISDDHAENYGEKTTMIPIVMSVPGIMVITVFVPNIVLQIPLPVMRYSLFILTYKNLH